MEAEARSVNDIPRGHAPLSTKKKFTQRAFLLLLLLLEARWWVGRARRIEFYFHSGESGVEPHTGFHFPSEGTRAYQTYRRFSYSYSTTPHNLSSQTGRFHEPSRFGGTSRRVSFLSSFPYWFTDQVSKRYDSFSSSFSSFSSVYMFIPCLFLPCLFPSPSFSFSPFVSLLRFRSRA